MTIVAGLKTTPLTALHRGLGAKMAAFGGYDMPIHYSAGILKEHLWTRSKCGLFDVSHMGPSFLILNDGLGGGDLAHARIAAIVETLVPADIRGLKPGQVRYTMLLNADGGILDDLMIARPLSEDLQGMLYIVANAGCKEQDFALLAAAAGDAARLQRADDNALVALQGPEAANVLTNWVKGVKDMSFMTHKSVEVQGERWVVARSGYTGEDGFEVLIPASQADEVVKAMLAHAHVRPIGLGARDSLRLEAGLCLYGHDIDATTSPIEAGLAWTIQKRRREAGDFPGAKRILAELANGPARKRVGFKLVDRAPAREGALVRVADRTIGVVTSGGFGPSVNEPVAMGYVEGAFASPGAKVELLVRDQPRAAEVVAMPFVPHKYHRG